MANKHTLINSIRNGLAESVGIFADLHWVRDLQGGDINQAALIKAGNTHWFIKYHSNAPDGMFAAEAQALAELAQSEIRVPSPVALGADGTTSWLVLEYLELSPHGPASLMGEQLAVLHGVSNDRFGWSRDNYIGSTPQLNSPSDSWVEFWRQNRLGPQLGLAKIAGFSQRLLNKGEKLMENLEHLIGGHHPTASLLHGDLWAGNKAFTADGLPVIFDPALYYGDRETDIAMTELFGGFDANFYAAYQARSPLPDGYPLRRDLYNLYHMLNHLNLFGSAYLARCEQMIDRLIAEIS